MLENRDYMRTPDYRSRRWETATGILLIINAAVYLLEAIARGCDVEDARDALRLAGALEIYARIDTSPVPRNADRR